MLGLLKKIFYTSRMVCGKGAVIHPSARVVNILGRKEAIRLGAHTHLKGELLTFAHGGEIEIGEYCFIGEHTRIWSAEKIQIGDRVLISHGVSIFDSLTHPVNARKRHEQFCQIIRHGHPKEIDLDESPVRIEDDAWIGCQSVILRGVTIGKCAIVGAGSVVSRDVPPFTVVAGNPAGVVRELGPDER